MNRDECAANAAAYVLGALEPAEAESYRRHLDTCTACREEVAALAPVADALPLAAPQHPVPEDLRGRVVGTVRAESRRAKGNGRVRRVSGLWRSRPMGRPAAAVALAAVVVAAVIAVALIGSGGKSGSAIIRASVYGSTGTAELRIRENRGDLIVRHLPAPAAGRIYEVWLARPNSTPTPAGALFSVTSDGGADVGIPRELRGVSDVLVTQEPAGGSRTPTTPPVITASIS